MVKTHSSIATDSERELSRLVGGDATATTENDPRFRDTDPMATASSEHYVARDTEDNEDSDEEVEAEEDEDDLDQEEEDDDDEVAADRVTEAALAGR